MVHKKGTFKNNAPECLYVQLSLTCAVQSVLFEGNFILIHERDSLKHSNTVCLSFYLFLNCGLSTNLRQFLCVKTYSIVIKRPFHFVDRDIKVSCLWHKKSALSFT